MSGPAAQRAARAERAGLLTRWTDVAGIECDVAPDVIEAVLSALEGAGRADVPPPLLTAVCGSAVQIAGTSTASAHWLDEAGSVVPAQALPASGAWTAPDRPGYWTFCQGSRMQRCAVAPAQAWLPAADAAMRPWGIAAQVHGLRGLSDGGIGDSSGVLHWMRRARSHGADAVALSPMHASMPIRSGFSPYSPSDRRWLEPLHGSPRQVLADAAQAVRTADAVLDAALAAHEGAPLVDWPSAAAAKQQWIHRLPGWLQQHQPERWQKIQQQIDEAGAPLASWAEGTAVLSGGPAPLHAFGQWLAQQSWQNVQESAQASGMQMGLIADLAVGFDPDGVEAQANDAAVMRGLELGAPPDAFNPLGQAWGITGYSPLALRAHGYAPFIALLRAVMAGRGGVRIDHILGLQRLWVVPRGAGAGQGIYLRYPFDDLLNLLVLESWRHRCLVIGEDLGVVPPGIRDALAARGVLGMDVLAFSRDASGFMAPARWRRSAVAMTSTHDLPPVAGWIQGRDLDWRRRLGWNDQREADGQARERATQLEQLETLVQAEGLASGDLQRDALALTARSPALLALLPLEDAAGAVEQPNLPGTVDEHPNWRRRLAADADDPAIDARLAGFARQRLQESTP